MTELQNKTTFLRRPTASEVRAHYENKGYEVRITKDGHITYRYPKYGSRWREGRWVSEYRLIDDELVLV